MPYSWQFAAEYSTAQRAAQPEVDCRLRPSRRAGYPSRKSPYLRAARVSASSIQQAADYMTPEGGSIARPASGGSRVTGASPRGQQPIEVLLRLSLRVRGGKHNAQRENHHEHVPASSHQRSPREASSRSQRILCSTLWSQGRGCVAKTAGPTPLSGAHGLPKALPTGGSGTLATPASPTGRTPALPRALQGFPCVTET